LLDRLAKLEAGGDGGGGGGSQILRLQYNYRSDPELLQVSSRLFYGNQLQPQMPTGQEAQLTQAKLLQSGIFPTPYDDESVAERPASAKYVPASCF
jgi:hypothetical protein